MAMSFTSYLEGRVEGLTERLAEAERLLTHLRERLAEAERLLTQMRQQSARDLDLIEQWCADEGEEYASAAAGGLAVGRVLLSEIDAFAVQRWVTDEGAAAEEGTG